MLIATSLDINDRVMEDETKRKQESRRDCGYVALAIP